jgi:mediator of RNA polymerase II transcription subunit 13
MLPFPSKMLRRTLISRCFSQSNPPFTSSLLPEPKIRHAYSHFLDAVRTRLISDIVETSLNKPRTGHLRQQVKRFKNGFVLTQNPVMSDWDTGWEHKAISR